jgi:hypothetical protein
MYNSSYAGTTLRLNQTLLAVSVYFAVTSILHIDIFLVAYFLFTANRVGGGEGEGGKGEGEGGRKESSLG